MAFRRSALWRDAASAAAGEAAEAAVGRNRRLDSWPAKIGIVLACVGTTYGMVNHTMNSGRGGAVLPTGDELSSRALSAARDALLSGRDVPSARALLAGSTTREAVRVPCRSEGLRGRADVVVRYHDATPDDVARRMRDRDEKHTRELRELEDTERRRTIARVNAALQRGDNAAAETATDEVRAREAQLKRKYDGGIADAFAGMLGKRVPQRPTAPARRAGGTVGDILKTPGDGSGNRGKAKDDDGTPSTSAARKKDETGAARNEAEKVDPSEFTKLVEPPVKPLMAVTARRTMWEEVNDGVVQFLRSMFLPARERNNTANEWVKVNTARDKEWSKDWQRTNATLAQEQADVDESRTGRRRQKQLQVPGALDLSEQGSSTAALRYASVSIVSRADDDDAVSGTAEEHVETVALAKCASMPTKAMASLTDLTRCEPDPLSLPSVVSRVVVGAAALLPTPLPSQCVGCVIGIDSPALPVFMERALYEHWSALHVVDSEPAMLEAAAAYAGLKPFGTAAMNTSRPDMPHGRFQLHTATAEDFLLRQTQKVDVLLVNMAGGGEIARARLQERLGAAGPKSDAVVGRRPRGATGAHMAGVATAQDSRYSAAFAKICASSLSSVGVAAFAMDGDRTEDTAHFAHAVRRTFGPMNVLEVATSDVDGSPVRVLLAAKSLPGNITGREVASRMAQLGRDFGWPFDASQYLPASYFIS